MRLLPNVDLRRLAIRHPEDVPLAKLGLKKSDNLKEALQERMRLYEEEHRQEDFSACLLYTSIYK